MKTGHKEEKLLNEIYLYKINEKGWRPQWKINLFDFLENHILKSLKNEYPRTFKINSSNNKVSLSLEKCHNIKHTHKS